MEVIKGDVIVCGGGTAGLPAALMAGRKGLKVIIVEDDERIGGAVSDMYIQNYCGTPVQGIYKEIKETMLKYSPKSMNENCFRHSSYILAWYDLFEGLDISIFTRQKIKKANTEGNKIISVESQDFIFQGKIFIDSTGDASLASMTSCKWTQGREAKSEYNERFAPEVKDEKVQQCTLMYSVRKYEHMTGQEPANWAIQDSEEYLIWGPTVYCSDPTDNAKLQVAQNVAMKQMPKAGKEWKEKGYYITSISPKLGVRETRRIIGNHILTYPEVMNKTKHSDSICVVNYCIDPWDPEGNPVHSSDTVESTVTPDYEIPYNCLVTKEVSNLIVAGRSISATHVVNSSLRVMGIVHIIGQAAGNAAYLSIKDNVSTSDINIDKLRTMQTEQGVKVSLD